MFQLFLNLVVGMLGVSIEYILNMFQANRKYTGSMLYASLEMFRGLFGESQFCY